MSADTLVVVTETTETIEVPGDTIVVVESVVEIISDTTPATSAAASAAASAASAAAAAAAVTTVLAGIGTALAAGTYPASFTTLTASDTVVIAATKKFYLDGVGGVGGDSYIVESAGNVVDHYAGGVKALSLTAGGAAVTGTLSASGRVSFGTTNANHSATVIGSNNATVLKVSAADQGSGVLAFGDGSTSALNCVIWRGSQNSSVNGNWMNFGTYDGTNGGFHWSCSNAALGLQTPLMALNSVGNLALKATGKLYLDGVAAVGDSYIVESAANVVDHYAGGVKVLSLTTSGAALVAGTVSAPSLILGTDTGSGLYRIGANNIGVAISGAKVLDISSGALLVTGWLNVSGNIGNRTATTPVGGIVAISNASGAAPAAFGQDYLLVGANVASGAGSGAVYATYDQTGNIGYLGALSPGAAWRTLKINAGGGNVELSAGKTSAHPLGLTVTGVLTASIAIALPTTQKLYLDGVAATGDTYLVESSANVLDIYAGAVKTLSLTTGGAAITGTLSSTGAMLCGGASGSATAQELSIRHNDTAAAKSYLSMGGATNNRGQIEVGGTALTDGYMAFKTEAAGSLAERLRISSAGDLAINATAKLRLDGVAGAGDTYIVESSANVLDLYAGGTKSLSLAGRNVFIDGATGVLSGGASYTGYDGVHLKGTSRSYLTQSAADYVINVAEISSGANIAYNVFQGALYKQDASTNTVTYTFQSAATGAVNSTPLTLKSTGEVVAASLTVSGDTRLATKTPASAAATGVIGTVAWDANYLYACTATDTWKRAALATW